MCCGEVEDEECQNPSEKAGQAVCRAHSDLHCSAVLMIATLTGSLYVVIGFPFNPNVPELRLST